MVTPTELKLLKNPKNTVIIPKLYDENEKRRFSNFFHKLMLSKKPILIKGVYSKGQYTVELIYEVINK